MDLTPDIVNEFVATGFPLTVTSGYSCVEVAPGTAVARLACDPTKVPPGDIVPGAAVFREEGGDPDPVIAFASGTYTFPDQG